jgi:phosphoribosylanthranilate isomerase
MIIKVCGMREMENIRAVEATGTDWMGFIFFPKSPRFVENVPDYLPQQSKRVGVFVNASIDEIVEKIKQFQLQLIQLHGRETPAFCRELRQRIPADMKIIKMIPIATRNDIQMADSYTNDVDYFLFESKIPTNGGTYGGSGQQFDWSILQRYQGSVPFLLTGGIGEEDAEQIAHFHHPQFI